MAPNPEISVIVPVKDEQDNVLPMLEEVSAAAADWPWAWELIFVDDGSTDHTWSKIKDAREAEGRVRAVSLRFNCGQTSAIAAGVAHARGRIGVTLDGDCQNDPNDIRAMVEELERADIVIGWRRDRADSSWRRFQSRFANGFRNALTSETVHDIGCGIKAFDMEKMREIPLFEGMHRFMPTLFRFKGWSVAEVVVRHRHRTRGVPKYGMWNRAFVALRDLFAVRWMRRRMIRYQIKEEESID